MDLSLTGSLSKKYVNVVIWNSVDYSTTMANAAFKSNKRGKLGIEKRNSSLFKLMKWITNAIEQGSNSKTFLNALLNASDPETDAQLSPSETIASSTGFMYFHSRRELIRIAAADTTSGSLTFTIYHCLANRSTWTRLRDEIRSSFENVGDITGQSTAHLSYLDAVIHEGNSSWLNLP